MLPNRATPASRKLKHGPDAAPPPRSATAPASPACTRPEAAASRTDTRCGSPPRSRRATPHRSPAPAGCPAYATLKQVRHPHSPRSPHTHQASNKNPTPVNTGGTIGPIAPMTIIATPSNTSPHTTIIFFYFITTSASPPTGPSRPPAIPTLHPPRPSPE